MTLNTAIWIIQILLGIKFITVSYTHGLRQTQPTMQQAIQTMGKFSQLWLSVTAVCTLMGSVGLILPTAMGILTWITPVTAVILAVMMLLSIFFHLKSREKPNIIASVILGTLAAFVAYGRWVLAPL
jgi:ATP/ADP translocase